MRVFGVLCCVSQNVFILICVNCILSFCQRFPCVDLSFDAESFRFGLGFCERLVEVRIVQMGEDTSNVLSKLNDTWAQILICVGDDPTFMVFQPGQ